MSENLTDPGTDRFAGRGDDFCALLMAAHDGLGFKESAALNARLVLLLANRVGDIAILEQALKLARERAGV
jgi:hypothetical protein